MALFFVSGMSVGILLTAYPPRPLSTLFSSPLYRIPPETSGKCETACFVYSTRNAENFYKYYNVSLTERNGMK